MHKKYNKITILAIGDTIFHEYISFIFFYYFIRAAVSKNHYFRPSVS